MKKFSKFILNNIKITVAFLIGIILPGVVYAATLIAANKISYDNSISELESTDVQNAIDELSVKADNYCSNHDCCPKGYICIVDKVEPPWDGTVEAVQEINNTYLISNGKQLAWLSEEVNKGNTFENKTIYITKDIDMGATFDEQWNVISGPKFEQIGSLSIETVDGQIIVTHHLFKGNIEGNNHSISNVYADYMFYTIGDNYIKDLTVKNSKMDSIIYYMGVDYSNYPSYYFIGSTLDNIKSIDNYMLKSGISEAAYMSNIKNSYNNSIVESTSNMVGGIVGTISGTIVENCINEGIISGETKWIGGIVGMNSPSEHSYINNCKNYGDVKTKHGAFRIAGIIGNSNSNITISNSINYGNIDGIGDGTASSYGAGGITGTIGTDLNDGDGVKPVLITNCYNKGNVVSKQSAGGIVGNLYKDAIDSTDLYNSYNEGDITATNGYAGGILGKHENGLNLTSSLSNYATKSYNRGNVKGLNAGGLIGAGVGISNSINYINPTGTNNYGVIAKKNGIETFNNVYYLNGTSSAYGTAKTQAELTNNFAKTVLGTDAWDYSSTYPKLKKANISYTDVNASVTYSNEILE